MCFKFLRQILWKNRRIFFFFLLTKRFPGCLKGSYFKDGVVQKIEVLERGSYSNFLETLAELSC